MLSSRLLQYGTVLAILGLVAGCSLANWVGPHTGLINGSLISAPGFALAYASLIRRMLTRFVLRIAVYLAWFGGVTFFAAIDAAVIAYCVSHSSSFAKWLLIAGWGVSFGFLMSVIIAEGVRHRRLYPT